MDSNLAFHLLPLSSRCVVRDARQRNRIADAEAVVEIGAIRDCELLG
jgi:hypothetical protein